MKYLVLMSAAVLLVGCTASRPNTVASAGPTALHDAAAPRSATSAATSPAGDALVVTFASGSTVLNAQAIATLDHAARLYRDANPIEMYSSGYASASGTEAGNLILSARRALMVKRALVARGIPANRLLVRAFGATEAGPAGGDSARRVVITWKTS
jgi:outer membrane protein OmpA-like peptidoglycan-associated protein